MHLQEEICLVPLFLSFDLFVIVTVMFFCVMFFVMETVKLVVNDQGLMLALILFFTL